MHLTFAPRGILQIENARITYKNFAGKPGQFSREGERDFTLIIDDQEACDAMLEDVNRDGAAWNVKIKDPRDEQDTPFMTLKVKVKFSDFGPRVYLKSGGRTVRLTEETIGCLDNMDIENIDLAIRPFDNITNGKPYRTAYLDSMHVTQRLDWLMEKYSLDEFPEE